MESSLNAPLFSINPSTSSFPTGHGLDSESVSLQPCAPYCPLHLQCEHFAQYILFEMNEILGTSNALKAEVSRTDLYRKDIYCLSQQALPAGLGLESTH